MSLIDKLSGEEEPKLPVHQFWGMLVEWVLGEATRQNVIDEFSLSTEDIVELDWIKTKIDNSSNKANFMHILHSTFMLAERKMRGYHIKATIQARIGRIA